MSLAQMSFSGAVMILAVAVMRAAALHRLPKRTFCALWGAVLARLLIPYALPSALSVYTLWAKAVQAAPRQVPGTQTILFMSGNAGTAAVSPSTPMAAAEFHVDPRMVLWLAGLAVCGVFFAAAYFKCRRDFRASLPVEQEFVARWLGENRLRRPLSVRQSDRIAAPLTYGVLRPVILLPKKTDWADAESLGYVLAHELTHIRHFDGVSKLLLCAAACVHWFNPAVWLMFALANRDMELACDEAVLRRFGAEHRSAYARALIRMEERKSGFAPLCSNFSKNAIEERITAIMKRKKTTVFSLVLACFLVLGTATAFATSAIVSDNKETAFTGNNVTPEAYAIYEPFGLTVDTGKLYYNGKLVRCFDDRIPENFRVKAVGYYEENGVIDVRAVRENVNNTSELIGLEVLSQTEYQDRVIVDPAKPTSGTDTNMFDDYEKYGLSCDESQKALFYNGKRVRLFWDSRASASQPVESERFLINSVSNWDTDGEIDLYAVRDFEQRDQNGYGELVGLRIAAQDEFEANTKSFAANNAPAETAE